MNMIPRPPPGMQPGQPPAAGRTQLASRRSAETAALLNQCKSFMNFDTPEHNIILQRDFTKFLPLFNHKLLAKLSESERNKLRKLYGETFSLLHPVVILLDETDENGVYYSKDRQHHKVFGILPPVQGKLNTLNSLGQNASQLIAAFFNASAVTSNPLDHRKDIYAAQIARAIRGANPKKGEVPQTAGNVPVPPGQIRLPGQTIRPNQVEAAPKQSVEIEWD